MKIYIKTGDQLSSLLDALSQEIVDASIQHRLFSDLVDSVDEYEREFRQSNTFWSCTIESLKEASLHRLCRVFDHNLRSLNLVNLLDTIKAHLPLFKEEHFRARLRNNAFVDSLAQLDRIPDEQQLDEDIEYVSCRNPLVKKLIRLRNNIVAHIGKDVLLGKGKIIEDNPLTQAEVKGLLEKSLDIMNRYSDLYRASIRSSQVIGYDDYKSVLSHIRRPFQKRDEDR